MTKVTTTAKIRELASQPKDLHFTFVEQGPFANGLKQKLGAEFIILACNNAARMAELLEVANLIILNPQFEDKKAHWVLEFMKFQRGENV